MAENQASTAKERVIAEKKDLDEKIAKLSDFLYNKADDMVDSGKLSVHQADLLVKQLDRMKEYDNILNERLITWEVMLMPDKN